MGQLRKFVNSILFLLVLTACTDNTTEVPIDKPSDTLVNNDTVVVIDEQPATIIKDTIYDGLEVKGEDKKKLDVLMTLNYDASYDKVAKQINVLKGIRPEKSDDDLAAKGLTEASGEMEIFGEKVQVVFHFKNDSLYAFQYALKSPNDSTTDRLLNGIRAYLSDQLGEPVEPNIEEENKFEKVMLWPEDKSEKYLKLDLNQSIIKWGSKKKSSPIM